MSHGDRDPFRDGVSRRTFIKGAGAVAVLGGSLYATAPAAARARQVAQVDTPLEHLIISCAGEPVVRPLLRLRAAGAGGRLRAATRLLAAGRGREPARSRIEFTSLQTPDLPHHWSAVHEQWNGGAMDGFYTSSRRRSATATRRSATTRPHELPFYYSLLRRLRRSAGTSSARCSGRPGRTASTSWPARRAGSRRTASGATAIFDYPIILDLLDAAGVTWKVYNISWDSVPFGNTDNVFVFWEKYAHDNRTRGEQGGFLNDLAHGRLPQVSWVIPSFARGWDEHPPADVSIGMDIQEELITALRESPAWDSSAYILTYDEHGGYFDHVPPPQLDAFGLGIRVPMWVISPWAKTGPHRAALPTSLPRP